MLQIKIVFTITKKTLLKTVRVIKISITVKILLKINPKTLKNVVKIIGILYSLWQSNLLI
jgi:hypothetical protein